MIPITPEDLPRFYAKIQISDEEDGCHLWTAGCVKDGYGVFSIQGKSHKSHRIAYQLAYGEIPANMCVCHSCDTPNCVNPKHFWLGTVKQNMNDRTMKRRTAQGKRHGTHTHPETRNYGDKNWTRKFPDKLLRGERNPQSKLSTTEVKSIKKRLFNGTATCAELAREYQVWFSTIASIQKGKTWKHVLL